MGKKVNTERVDRGSIEICFDKCKGCGLCISACPVNVLTLAKILNSQGYQTARYLGTGCTACGICFYVCPEPGAITVYKLRIEQARSMKGLA
jgi:2-oxoglutarate ferredoxin oxidoreductase subunit delta